MFKDKLRAVMSLTGLSNIELSRLIHVDPSLISRYRSGTRAPRKDSEISVNLSYVLWNKIINSGLKSELSVIMGTEGEEPDKDSFFEWMFSFSDLKYTDATAAERLIEVFDSCMPFTAVYRNSGNDRAIHSEYNDQEYNNKEPFYCGNAGLRTAAVRFLTAALKNRAEEIWLYSDEDMSWMIEDRAFFQKWAVLMNECIAGGINMTVIHNISRNPSEMAEAIKGWMPLYISGRIKSFYSSQQNDPRFSHTLFLCPETHCVTSFSASGAKGGGIYSYSTDKRVVGAYRETYIKLLESSSPLFELSKESGISGTLSAGITVLGDSHTFRPDNINNIKITIGSEYVTVTYISEPCLSFRFTHPLMCRAFKNYADLLIK